MPRKKVEVAGVILVLAGVLVFALRFATKLIFEERAEEHGRRIAVIHSVVPRVGKITFVFAVVAMFHYA